MVVFYSIPVATILLILFVLLSPIIRFGMALGEVMIYLSQHMLQIVLIVLAVFLVLAIVSYMLSKEVRPSICIIFNCPALVLVPAFTIAEIANDCMGEGFIWGLLNGVIYSFLGLVAFVLTIAITLFCFWVNLETIDNKMGQIIGNKFSLGTGLCASIIGAALQAVILVLASDI